MAMDGLAAGNYHLFRKRCTGPVLGLEACVGDRRYFTRFYLLYVVIGSGPFLIGMTLGKPRLPLLMFLSPPELVLALGAGNPNPDIFRGNLLLRTQGLILTYCYSFICYFTLFIPPLLCI
jgi:hypothetical protein